ncbi:hypothetical protein OKW21_006571 [Catalinimonas alkaloidigena]|uniref:hypothetical protein n=1 Tax=Catalinimonas alkaloidigena TaxID=1075417 RepID=UPI0024065174|nr:hypothetical protein [Catalinimonas alkaloidigena]MDF9801262.1 hypothetical protein [Catalinimonas alkaloidigena]
MAECPNGFRISSHLQEIIAYLGSDYVFEEGSELLKKLLDVDLSAKQLQKVSEHMGSKLEEEAAIEQIEEHKATQLEASQQVYTYVQMDGSMLLTREEKWKEIKLGRLFQIPIKEAYAKKYPKILHSEYVAYLGDAATFLKRLDHHIPEVKCPIFIADGASWIWDWIEKNHTNSLQILDFYHALQYAWDFVKLAIIDVNVQKSWIEAIKNILLDNRVDYLLRHFEMLKSRVKDDALLMLDRLIRYYKRNQHRMYYGFYRERKLLIGSGAIESAHREVIQHRLKRSGQRWSKTGAQQIAQLRVAKKSNQWQKVINIAQYGKIAA